MKTIEQLLKTTIESGINAITALYYDLGVDYPYTVSLTNDIRFHDKDTTLNTIPGIIKTGAGVRSNIPGFDAVQTPVMFTFECAANFVQTFLGCLSVYIQSTNGVVASVTDTLETESTADDIVYSYKIDWEMPIASGSPYPATVKSLLDGVDNETADVMLVVLRCSILYSTDQTLDDRKTYIDYPTRAWIASTQAYWTANGTVAGIYDVSNIVDESSSLLPTPTAADIAGRVLHSGAYTYYVSTGWKEILGITSYVEKFTPAHTPSTPITSPANGYDFETYDVVISFGFTRNKSDTLHKYLASFPHATIANTSCDMSMKFVVTSLAIAKVSSVKVSDVQVSNTGTFETVNVTVIKAL